MFSTILGNCGKWYPYKAFSRGLQVSKNMKSKNLQRLQRCLQGISFHGHKFLHRRKREQNWYPSIGTFAAKRFPQLRGKHNRNIFLPIFFPHPSTTYYVCQKMYLCTASNISSIAKNKIDNRFKVVHSILSDNVIFCAG